MVVDASVVGWLSRGAVRVECGTTGVRRTATGGTSLDDGVLTRSVLRVVARQGPFLYSCWDSGLHVGWRRWVALLQTWYNA